ncbi:putative glycosyl transferase family 17 protein [Botrytis fragariae]|uniref:Putative glycosyl transferase family 17 protein n=1 Tax=Botrytis fragariae TaxID=1964551 RepID=A0A8H6AJ30_9HELO|nr:putative glycosyl transferase family 17 protein [Botrytis fragariae]KAF5868195.1 putative glycosyl transferase family 17 protein [Botrytis fragariae]
MAIQLSKARYSLQSQTTRIIKILSIIVFFYICTYFLLPRIQFTPLTITEEDISFEQRTAHIYNNFLPASSSDQLCASHSLTSYPDRSQKRKIYDLFMVNSELDWLEIRLNEMNTEVDYFVILEAPTTFTGLAKNMTFQEHRAKFSAFEDKIIYHVLTDAPPPVANTTLPGSKEYEANAWIQEKFQRDAMFTQVFPKLVDAQKPNEGDVILVSDIDEVIRPASLQVLRNCVFPVILTLRSQFYYYSFQFRHRGEQWAHPQATFYRGLENTIKPHSLRSRHGGHVQVDEKDSKSIGNLWNAAWHCSSCFSTLNEMRRKMESFSHTNLNKQEFRMTDRIVDRVGRGKDLWDRFGQWYKRIDNNNDIPSYIKDHRSKFGYMVDRDGEGAGFVDYDEVIAQEKKGMDLI